MTRRFRVNLTASAQTDLEQIFYNIAADSPMNATEFIVELERKVYSLEAFPERQPLIPENEFFGTEYRHLNHKKYRIVYRIVQDTVFVLRIVHGSKLLDDMAP